MKKILFVLGILLAIGLVWGQNTQSPSASMLGLFNAEEIILLKPAFVNGVNDYLKRNNARLISEMDNYVGMAAKYDYELKIELIINKAEKKYEIIVTTAQNRYNSEKAQNICNKIVFGVYQSFKNQLYREPSI